MLVALAAAPSRAQSARPVDENLGTISNSPYSRLGLGDEFLLGGSRNQALGGAGAGSPSGENVNLINPALLYYNRSIGRLAAAFYGVRDAVAGKP